MDLYVVLLPLILVILFFLWFGAFIWEVPWRIWFPLTNSIALEGLWICQLVTETLSDRAFSFLFTGSIYCGLVIFAYSLWVWAYIKSKREPDVPPPSS